jgi:hypothetical protein
VGWKIALGVSGWGSYEQLVAEPLSPSTDAGDRLPERREVPKRLEFEYAPGLRQLRAVNFPAAPKSDSLQRAGDASPISWQPSNVLLVKITSFNWRPAMFSTFPWKGCSFTLRLTRYFNDSSRQQRAPSI